MRQTSSGSQFYLFLVRDLEQFTYLNLQILLCRMGILITTLQEFIEIMRTKIHTKHTTGVSVLWIVSDMFPVASKKEPNSG